MISDILSRLWRHNPAAPATSAKAEAVNPPSDAMSLAADIVAKFEGFRSAAYLCPAGVYTVGYGSTRAADGKPVRPGLSVTEEEARALLQRDLAGAARAVERLVTVPLEPHETAALVSFVYNVGQGAFAESTLLRMLNTDARTSTAAQFARWNKAGGKVLAGLTRRRAAEAAMFRGENWR